MISNRSDGFEDVVAEEAEGQRDRYEFARALLEEQAAELIEASTVEDEAAAIRASFGEDGA